MDVHFGLETEYGISRARPSKGHDVVAESIALVRATQQPGVRMRWDYSCEDPHVDARGFRVDELRQDFDEADYFARDAARPLSFSEIKSDLALRNGARFYNDHAHPEYCTPECVTLQDLLIQDRAGDQLMMDCAAAVSEASVESPEGPVQIYKNNTDFQGHSYGCHENYLIPREIPWENVRDTMLAFLVTRQVLVGSGKFGWEQEDRFVGPGFQISQRGDFFSVIESVDTMQRRPVINTRDEPHANIGRYRRFHVICGDANLAPYATYLKVGTTAAVLQTLIHGIDLDRVPMLADPVKAICDLSRDASWRWECRLADGRLTTALEIQQRYRELAEEGLGLETPAGFRLADWENTLRDLEVDPLATSRRLDWSAKYVLLNQFREAEGLSPDDPWLRSLDLSYHLLDSEEGLFMAMQDQGHFEMPFPMETKHPTRLEAPSGTRARVRGACIERFGSLVESAQWDHVTLHEKDLRLELDLRDLFGDRQLIDRQARQILESSSVRDLQALPFAKTLRSS